MMKLFFSALLGVFTVFMPVVANAEMVTGRAFIQNNNVVKAEADARRDAMRSYVESKIGVYVDSETQVEEFTVVRDKIVAKSQGYVLVKKVVSTARNGDMFTVTLDLEANNSMIQTAVTDVPTQLQSMDEDSSRQGIQVAILDDDHQKTNDWNMRFASYLSEQGFRVEINDAVLEYLGKNLNTSNDMLVNTEIRRIGKDFLNRFGANAIIRGRVSLFREPILTAAGTYKVIADATCQLVPYDSNTVDSSSKMYVYFGDTPEEAERIAKEEALRMVAEELAVKALKSNQLEYRGGVHQLKASIIINGFSKYSTKKQQILNAIQNANCRIVRSAIMGNGALAILVHSTNYNNLEELKEGVFHEVNTIFPTFQESEADNMAGNTRLMFKI